MQRLQTPLQPERFPHNASNCRDLHGLSWGDTLEGWRKHDVVCVSRGIADVRGLVGLGSGSLTQRLAFVLLCASKQDGDDRLLYNCLAETSRHLLAPFLTERL